MTSETTPDWVQESTPIDRWTDFVQALGHDVCEKRWYYRGAIPDWGIESSLERAMKDWHIPLDEAREVERVTRRDFKRAFPRLSMSQPPDDGDTLGWLALMQHHGAPTRLSDWTYSPFVAAYFACEALLMARDSEAAVVWAVSAEPFDNPASLIEDPTLVDVLQRFRDTREGKLFEAIFERRDPLRFVFPVNPYRLHQRLTAQQGVFLCPADISVPFMDNLTGTRERLPDLRIIQYRLPRDILGDAVAQLRRMNILPTTLFPGLDGYARSIRTLIEFHAKRVAYSGTEL